MVLVPFNKTMVNHGLTDKKITMVDHEHHGLLKKHNRLTQSNMIKHGQNNFESQCGHAQSCLVMIKTLLNTSDHDPTRPIGESDNLNLTMTRHV